MANIIGEGGGPLDRGRRKYQEKDYTGALSAFTEAVNLSSGNILLTALDHRAAAYEKLQQLQHALHDAKRMIDLAPGTSKGYLRCGKVLELKGNLDLAFKIYERGLKMVKIGDDDKWTTLQRMFNKAKRALDPEKVLDPLIFLPLELAEMVCQYLPTRDRVICLAVSKPWKRLLESLPKLWTTLDTSYARRPVSLKSLKAHLKRAKYTVDTVIINYRACLDAQKLSYITNSCKTLRRMELRGGGGPIGDSLIKSVRLSRSIETLHVGSGREIAISTIREVLDACHNSLIDAAFLNVKPWPFNFRTRPPLQTLKRLRLKNGIHPGAISIDWLSQAIPNLESLNISNFCLSDDDFTHWKHLETLELTSTDIHRMPNLPDSLLHLIISNNNHLEVDDVDDHEPPILPHLETFACESTKLGNSYVKAFTQESIKRGNLRRLAIGDRLVRPLGPVDDEYPTSQSVENLSLAFLDIHESRLMHVVGLYPNITTLDVSGTPITGVAVKAFVQKGIKSLKLNECKHISTDAVDWARGQGCEVEFQFPSQEKRVGGYREIRHL